jgi:hypothetical protein
MKKVIPITIRIGIYSPITNLTKLDDTYCSNDLISTFKKLYISTYDSYEVFYMKDLNVNLLNELKEILKNSIFKEVTLRYMIQYSNILLHFKPDAWHLIYDPYEYQLVSDIPSDSLYSIRYLLCN